ncbi:MAG: amino acid racemase [Anaerolineaceae bacterium]|nr:amino acid racemase [Anaerolineaceae bacterium]
MKEKVIGILGGQGPEATLDLYRRIIKNTPAHTDQEHFRTIIDCNPKGPNPNNAITKGEPDPTLTLCETARNLEKAGVDFIVIPCNTVHIFLDAIQASVSIPIYSIVDETVAALLAQLPQVRQVGLLASPAVVATGLYAKKLGVEGVSTTTPYEDGMQLVHDVIFAVKAGDKGPEVKAKLIQVANDLISRGAQALILGCTELPLVLSQGDLAVPAIDTLEVLALAAVREAKAKE